MEPPQPAPLGRSSGSERPPRPGPPPARCPPGTRGAARASTLRLPGPRGGGRHTHSCMERLQYSMWRGAPFLLNWSTV